jgi:O-antigen ligase
MLGFVASVGILLILYGFVEKLMILLKTSGIVALSLLVVSPPVISSIFDVFTRGQTVSTLISLSGRTTKWIFAFNYMLRDGLATLLFGYGAYAGARFEVMPKLISVPASSSTHNTWVDLVTSAGVIGSGLFALSILFAVRVLVNNLRISPDMAERIVIVEAISVLVLFLVRSMFTRVLFLQNSIALAFIVGLVVYFSKDYSY